MKVIIFDGMAKIFRLNVTAKNNLFVSQVIVFITQCDFVANYVEHVTIMLNASRKRKKDNRSSLKTERGRLERTIKNVTAVNKISRTQSRNVNVSFLLPNYLVWRDRPTDSVHSYISLLYVVCITALTTYCCCFDCVCCQKFRTVKDKVIDNASLRRAILYMYCFITT